MKEVTPSVFLIAETAVTDQALDFLGHMEVENWGTDALSDAEYLTELAGKTCYKSFDTKLNLNLTKTGGRNNHDYIQDGIVKQRHGSVLEHSSMTFAFCDVSRVLTHELVRHRVGTAFSQESGRYVRTDVIHMYIPPEIKEDLDLLAEFVRVANVIEAEYNKLVIASGVNDMKDFGKKKKITSALRRLLPNGMANTIIMTMNHRTCRHLLSLRTSAGAEVEIRLAFFELFKLVKDKYPAIYADAKMVQIVDDSTGYIDPIPEIHFDAEKV